MKESTKSFTAITLAIVAVIGLSIQILVTPIDSGIISKVPLINLLLIVLIFVYVNIYFKRKNGD